MTELREYIESHTRSSRVSVLLDGATLQFRDGADENERILTLHVSRVLVTSAWNHGGYKLLDGYPLVSLFGKVDGQGECIAITFSSLVEVPAWLSDLIARATPTDLEHPAS